MFHLAGVAMWLTQTTVGGTHVLVPRFDPVAVLDAIERHRVTNTALIPTMLQALVDHPDLGAYNRSSLRIVVYAGSPAGEALLQRAMTAFPDAGFVQAYGMTELAPTATILTPDDHRHGALPLAARHAGERAHRRGSALDQHG
jgi:acyl-CoA synthetase (AMP-forming)/AMP-acid ligase II